MDEFTIKNRAGITNRFIKVEGDIYDGHYTVFNNTGKDYYLLTDAYYIREIIDNGKVIGIDPEGGLPINALCIGDEINGMKVKEFKITDVLYPINSPISNIIITFE